ncbi:MAG: DUF2029 domain-containing protein [Deltaproteobacteria bacterium]|nr:DUF2029 domain-containing protein [Deltaproteobacteria bacterium]MBW2371601.1 DUF2029 domain-containing protein [Deltaproteobacteria bacterium]
MGAFLRLDWLAALMLALCQLARGRSFAAGVLLGVAAMARLFPAFFLLGPAVLAARDCGSADARTRRCAWPPASA